MISITFIYIAQSRWLSTNVTPEEYRNVMVSGLFDGKPVDRVLIWEREYDDSVDKLYYSFVLAKQGRSAFVLESEPQEINDEAIWKQVKKVTP